MPRELLIIGTGGLAKECAQLARRIDASGARWSTISYVTNDAAQLGQQLPYGHVNRVDAALDTIVHSVDVVIGIGHPALRYKIASKIMENHCFDFPNLMHPNVEIDPGFVRLGRGNIITKGVVMTCDITIGDFNLLNWNSTIGHDARIGNCNVINPGSSISGNVQLSDACLLGTGARILENLRVCSRVTVGAGAVVTKSITQAGVYIGAPAHLQHLI